jgi:hypothetical protein
MPPMSRSVEAPAARGWLGDVLRSRPLQLVVSLALLVAGAVFISQAVGEATAAPAVDGHHDFLAFHAAARLVSQGQAAGHLYDPASITALERQVIATPVGAGGYMPYLSPPFAAALQAPLGFLSQRDARVVWLIISIPLALLCCWLATTGLRTRERLLASACLVGTFPFFQALVEGQWSFVMLAGCLGAVLAARSGRPGWAGVGLAVLALKPPLLVPVLVVLLCMRAWRTLLPAVAVVSVVWLVTLPFTGWSTQLDYAGYLVQVVGAHLDGAGAAGAAVWHGAVNGMEGINGLVVGYVGQSRVLVVDALIAVGVLAVVARWAQVALRVRPSLSDPQGRWVVIAGVAAALLVDLHLYPQDCVLVLVALPMLTAAIRPDLRLGAVLAMAVFMELSRLDQSRFTPHLFTLAMAGFFIWSCRQALGAGARRPAEASRSSAAAPG